MVSSLDANVPFQIPKSTLKLIFFIIKIRKLSGYKQLTLSDQDSLPSGASSTEHLPKLTLVLKTVSSFPSC